MGEEARDAILLFFIRSSGGEPGEGSVSRESRDLLPAGPAPPPAHAASFLPAFQPNPPGETPGKDKAIK